MMKVRGDERVEGAQALGGCDDCARWYQVMHDARCTTTAKHCVTLRANGPPQSSLAWPCCRRLIWLQQIPHVPIPTFEVTQFAPLLRKEFPSHPSVPELSFPVSSRWRC